MSPPLTHSSGQVVALRGPVIDVHFPTGALPEIQEALQVAWDRPGYLIAEVQSHLDETTVRAVALLPTAGLRRGADVHATGGPITLAGGGAGLGRVLGVLGGGEDNGPPLPAPII